MTRSICGVDGLYTSVYRVVLLAYCVRCSAGERTCYLIYCSKLMPVSNKFFRLTMNMQFIKVFVPWHLSRDFLNRLL
jgi:hypothetical protein